MGAHISFSTDKADEPIIFSSKYRRITVGHFQQLARFCSSACWLVSYLVGNHEERYSRDETQPGNIHHAYAQNKIYSLLYIVHCAFIVTFLENDMSFTQKINKFKISFYEQGSLRGVSCSALVATKKVI